MSGIGRARGFTLLEILIVISIIGLFIGYFALQFDSGRSADMLESTASELRSAALLAKRRSFAHRQDQFLVFRGNEYQLTNRAPGPDFAERDFIVSEEDESDLYSIPKEVNVEIMLVGETRWSPLNSRVWKFLGSGLSEPLRLRLSHEDSYTILDFNALTAIADEETLIR